MKIRKLSAGGVGFSAASLAPCRRSVERVYVLAREFRVGQSLTGNLRHKQSEAVRIRQSAPLRMIFLAIFSPARARRSLSYFPSFGSGGSALQSPGAVRMLSALRIALGIFHFTNCNIDN